MKVKAIALGYFNNRRMRVGDQFVVSGREYSSKWMESMEPKAQIEPEPPEPISASKPVPSKYFPGKDK